jgi:hypothetical protein
MGSRGMQSVLRQIQASIEAADKQFRATHEGLPINVIVADFAEFGPGVELTREALHSYAEAVSSGEPFEWHLSA